MAIIDQHPEKSAVATADENTSLSNTSRSFRIGVITLLVGLGGGLLWAAFASLDEGVPTAGMVAIDTKRKAVQHLQGGIVSKVMVKEGSVVTEGDVLMSLDAGSARATQVTLRQQYIGLRAMEDRLVAEQQGAKRIEFHEDIKAEGEDYLVKQQMQNQELLFVSRRAALAAELAAIGESAMGQQESLDNLKRSLQSRQQQMSFLKEVLSGLKELVDEGYAPKSQQLEKEAEFANLMATISELQGSIQMTQRSINEARQRIAQRRQEYQKEVETQLADVRRDVDGVAEKLRAASNDLKRVDIRSPASGQVVGLTTQTVGAVVQAGQKIMDIVPEREMLLLETRVPPNLIDRVRAGMPVDARFSSFAHSPQLVVSGRLESISGDLITPPNDAPPYFLARIAVTDEGVRQLGDRELQPGMPVEVIIKTGERTVLTYLLHPLLKRIAASLKEE